MAFLSIFGFSFVTLFILSSSSETDKGPYLMDGDPDRGYTLAQKVYTENSPPNHPSQRLTDKSEMDMIEKNRKENLGTRYGGARSDPKHVGGFVFNDTEGWEPKLWQFMIDKLHIRSIMDIGCGLGVSTQWFVNHGLDTLCLEGSQEAVRDSLVPDNTIEHDFAAGPWWPKETYDAVWCVEFTEHVDFHLIKNYIATMMKAKYIFVSHSLWGGWHHTVVKDDWWWIEYFKEWGFIYLPHMTELARKQCPYPSPNYPRDNSHFHFRGLVFRNSFYGGKHEMIVTKEDVLAWEKNADESSYVKRIKKKAISPKFLVRSASSCVSSSLYVIFFTYVLVLCLHN